MSRPSLVSSHRDDWSPALIRKPAMPTCSAGQGVRTILGRGVIRERPTAITVLVSASMAMSRISEVRENRMKGPRLDWPGSAPVVRGAIRVDGCRTIDRGRESGASLLDDVGKRFQPGRAGGAGGSRSVSIACGGRLAAGPRSSKGRDDRGVGLSRSGSDTSRRTQFGDHRPSVPVAERLPDAFVPCRDMGWGWTS